MSTFNLSEFVGNRIEASVKSLHAAAAKMPEDKIQWSPDVEGNVGRDALDQILECASLLDWMAEGYLAGELPPLNWDDVKVVCDAHRTQEQGLTWLASAGEKAVSAAREFPVDNWTVSCKPPFFNPESTWLDFTFNLLIWNNVYHEGQINYVQVLYGDKS